MTNPYQHLYGPENRPAERRFTIHYGFALLALFSLIGTLGPAIFWFVIAGDIANDPTTDPQGQNAGAGVSAMFGILWLLWGGMWTLIWTAFAVHHTLQGRRA
jgi:hypothetical protein